MEAVLSSSSSSTLEWPGRFVFDPLDEVLVVHYLHPKATEISYCKCLEVIPERDLYGTEEPWQIWEKMEEAKNCIRNKEEMFFFTRLKRVSSKSNRRCKRSIGKGCWKVSKSRRMLETFEAEDGGASATTEGVMVSPYIQLFT
ncbi:NAC domain-containing protein 41-like [Quercus lobata]|uniref:NAC domain-containing protein 41-like n=1 Tax=Quercus lobata TaxID=97700 RepID=UPI00124526A0|nr:NAC domain-containing protein 41-like [Quercus lobata]